MEKIILASQEERHHIFQTAAAALRIAPEMVEKDFWVCRILQKLFQDKKLRNILRFKGGTSLSKVFHLIRRFSEDVDLILDWRCITGEDPLLLRSKTKQDIFNKSIQESSGKYISGELRTMIDTAMGGECSVFSDADDEHVILLQYPLSFRSSYIVPHIRLEIGPLAAWLPNQEFPVLPYVAETFPQLNIAPISVPTILAERTFWEKVTILHQEHHRPAHLHVPLRYSRHYYDLYMMMQSECVTDAMRDISLLQQVVEFKQKFYPRAWAHYELAVPGTIELLPAPHSIRPLQADYAAMKNMIFGDYPSWDMIIRKLTELQQIINGSNLSEG